MGRYLKSVSMKAADGTVLKFPFCCTKCKKESCSLPCDDYAAEMGNVKCSKFDMEWDIEDRWLSMLTGICIISIGLIIGALILKLPPRQYVEFSSNFTLTDRRDISTTFKDNAGHGGVNKSQETTTNVGLSRR